MSPTNDFLQAFLRRLLLRSDLTTGEQDAVLGMRGRLVEVKRGQEIVMPGTVVDHATLVVSGILGRYDQMADGSRQITALHIVGDMADLHSVPIPRPVWGIEALSPGAVLFVPHSDVRRAAATYPEIGMAFWRDTVVDTSVLAKWTANLGRADASARMAHLLCEMGIRIEAIGQGTKESYQLPITQANLADALGITTVHANRTLMTLKQTCATTIIGGQVTIRNWDALVATARFDDEYLVLRRG